ncbi:MAG: glycosyltransferase family 9 protein [Clostridiales bacterium]|jgi:ADP-heptose:LPS heptosyltransferase|nr:glycosyltransferase family 9 protein [Clostridiales bacterium]
MGKVKRLFKRENKGERFFLKYAFGSKFHFKYKSNKVILFRLDLIGDCTMFTSAALAIREYYKGVPMTVVCLSISRPVFERLGVFDKIISIDFRPEAVDWNRMKPLIAQLRSEKYDILLQPQLSKYPIVDILAAAAKCNLRISIEPLLHNSNSAPEWVNMTKFIYDQFVPYPRGNVSEFDCYGVFVRGITNSGYKTIMPKLPYGKQEFIAGDYYVLFPGASLAQKMWPTERFARVAEHILAKTGLTAVILGSENEQSVSDRLKQSLYFGTASTVVDLIGKTSISDVIDIIGNAKFVISNDTSGVHIAAAVNTPSVAIAGGWHFNRFLPYHIEDIKDGDKLPRCAFTRTKCFNCDWNREYMLQERFGCVVRYDQKESCECIDLVTVEQVIELVDRVIEEDL